MDGDVAAGFDAGDERAGAGERMSGPRAAEQLEEQIAQWRAYLRSRRAIQAADVAELEAHLRDQVESLLRAGLAEDEAFLVAVKRMGALDAISNEFAREHSDRLWKQLVVSGEDEVGAGKEWWEEAIVAFLMAVAAALLLKAPALFGYSLEDFFYARNVSFLVLPALIGYFVWKRRLSARWVGLVAGVMAVAAVVMNAYPFDVDGDTAVLAVIHLPIALWLAMGIVYAGQRWWTSDGRMDFIRFTGELFIYYVLIALGGGVLTGATVAIFTSIEVDPEWFIANWLIPCGAAGALVVGAWLVEAKQSVVENMAPVLARLFTPLFAAVLLAFLGTMLWTGRGIDVEREILIAFDLLLVVVLALLLYSISARDSEAPRGIFDYLLVTLLVSALLVDILALAAIVARITDFGFTPNRVAALGENVLLLINLGWSAYLYATFLTGRGTFHRLERWQTAYLPVFFAWAAIVVALFPPLFGFR